LSSSPHFAYRAPNGYPKSPDRPACDEKGGYYLITTPEELQDFLRCEYQAKMNDMQQTVEAMTKAASQCWGPDTIQLKLI